jgi:RNase P subunit RPR2
MKNEEIEALLTEKAEYEKKAIKEAISHINRHSSIQKLAKSRWIKKPRGLLRKFCPLCKNKLEKKKYRYDFSVSIRIINYECKHCGYEYSNVYYW